MSQFSLLGQKRFSGIFWTQSIGAWTDCFFKQTLLALVVERKLGFMGLSHENIGLLAGAIFMAPYFLFSATAGQLADKLDKASIIRKLKLTEIFFAVIGAIAIYYNSIDGCMLTLVFFAVQAAFFGPLKYAILPQLLQEEELVTGNAWVETSTNLFILAGTIMGTEFILRGVPDYAIGLLLVTISCLGYFFSNTIPVAPSANPSLHVNLNPFVPTWQTLKLIAQKRAILNSILGISWFWALGMVMLNAFPFYTTDYLKCSLEVSTLLFLVFSVGIAVGSMWCERLSYGRLELGLVPFGSMGISLFLGALWLLGDPLPVHTTPLKAVEFLQTGGGLAICACVFFFCLFSGFFIVPLYTLIQQRSDPETRARVIAGNNIVNAVFMVSALAATAWLRSLHLTLPQVFGVSALFNMAVAIYIYTLIPEFGVRFIAYLIAHGMYRLKVVGEGKIPHDGGLILAANHPSFVDWLIVMAAVRRPVHFVMWYTYFEKPVVRSLFKAAGVIPISSARLRPQILADAFASIKQALENGEVVCIFPEGTVTKTGELNTFRNGIEKMVAETPVPVYPMALCGLWGSYFSRYKGGLTNRSRRRPLRSHLEVIIGDPVPPEEVKAEVLQDRVARLGSEKL
ncbi:MFS transporter [bacterium]|nr:MFS transporter [bacterium]